MRRLRLGRPLATDCGGSWDARTDRRRAEPLSGCRNPSGGDSGDAMTSDRPRAAVRIGVTGHRTLPKSPGFTANLDNAVRLAAQAAGSAEGSSCTVVSALAEGADRIVV